ncbi:MAG: TIGR02186 family protein [Minwuia sp.]|uniref:TIGR02186 family protein n=1 Tax=Minwuia sp. TaxID=2493630 RepID=UPI003A839DC0
MARLAGLLLLLTLCGEAGAQTAMVADISSRRIGIDSGFKGTELLLFGSLSQPGDVVIVVKGPPQPLTVRRKERVAGIWVNTDSVTYEDVPSFYAVVSSRPLDEIAADRVLRRHDIGIRNLSLQGSGSEDEDGFDNAIRRLRLDNGLFFEDGTGVSVRNGRLYRANVAFPANVPVGQYTTRVYLFQDGNVIAAETSPILIDKTGVERAIFSFAHQWPLFYGIFAVLIAGFAGWFAAQVFRSR